MSIKKDVVERKSIEQKERFGGFRTYKRRKQDERQR